MLNILVVDDSSIMRQKIKIIIDELGHNIAGEAKTGSEAIFLAENSIPDLVTMDITMPGMDGVETTKILKKKYPNIKIIMVTSQGEENLVRKAITYGAKGYILKPVNKEKIEELIAKIFNKEKKENIDSLLSNDFDEKTHEKFNGWV